jgi:hypothetical protein
LEKTNELEEVPDTLEVRVELSFYRDFDDVSIVGRGNLRQGRGFWQYKNKRLNESSDVPEDSIMSIIFGCSRGFSIRPDFRED